MASVALEQMLSSVKGIREENTLTLNIYTNGVSQMYTGPMGPPGGIGGFGGPGGFGSRKDFDDWNSFRRNEFNQTGTENNYEEDFNSKGTFNPIGTKSNFQPGSFGNIQQGYNLGEMTGDSSLNKYNLTERYDFSGHNSTLPHLNQNINDMNQFNKFGQPQDIIGGGLSNKSLDGYKGIGLAHHIDLFKK